MLCMISGKNDDRTFLGKCCWGCWRWWKNEHEISGMRWSWEWLCKSTGLITGGGSWWWAVVALAFSARGSWLSSASRLSWIFLKGESSHFQDTNSIVIWVRLLVRLPKRHKFFALLSRDVLKIVRNLRGSILSIGSWLSFASWGSWNGFFDPMSSKYCSFAFLTKKSSDFRREIAI